MLTKLLAALRNARPHANRVCRARRLAIESLEERNLLDGAMGHYLFDPQGGANYKWQDANPSTSSVIDINYDYRSLNGFTNEITPGQRARVEDALQMWTQATNGRLHFIRNTTAPLAQIINIGTGDLRAIGEISAPLGAVGEGGDERAFTDAKGNRTLQQGFAWLDRAENWNDIPGIAPVGTFDYFTVTAHEIGHALGMGHLDDLDGPNIMDSVYAGAKTEPSVSDRTILQSLYPPLAGLPIVKTQSVLAIGADAGAGPQVRVFNGTVEKFSFLAYNVGFAGGVRVAVGDVNGDHVPDIITAPGPGGGPDVHVYDGVSGQMINQFYAYSPFYSGGVYIAAGDVNGDGFADIICGADQGGGPNITVFDVHAGKRLLSFFAYDPRFIGGVRVSAADVTGDGRADIVAGAGPGGGPNITIFSGTTGAMVRSFFAYDPRFTLGIYVSTGDVNGDGKADILAGAGVGGGPNVTIFDGSTGAMISTFNAFDSGSGGVRVTAANAFGTGIDAIYAVSGPGSSPHVRLFKLPVKQLDDFYAFDSQFQGGVFIAGNP